MSIQRSALKEVVAGTATIDGLIASDRLVVEGHQAKLGELLGLLDPPHPNFDIVTPYPGDGPRRSRGPPLPLSMQSDSPPAPSLIGPGN